MGLAPVTGMGLALNGGTGNLVRFFGSACDNIIGMQLVTADGDLVELDDSCEDQDLWWAVRGAGSTLGVATRIKFKLHDVTSVHSGLLVFPNDPELATANAIVKWMRDRAQANPNFHIAAAFASDPDAGKVILCTINYIGADPVDVKNAFIQPLRDLGPVQDTVGQWIYAQTQNGLMHGIMGREALRAGGLDIWEYWTGGYLPTASPSDATLREMVATVNKDMPECPFSLSLIQICDGPILRASPAPVGFKDGVFEWVVQIGWGDESHHAKGLAYAAEMKAAMTAHGQKAEAYVNFADCAVAAPGPKDPSVRVGGIENLERVKAVKRRVDPRNVFCSTPFAKLLGEGPVAAMSGPAA